MIEEKNTHDIIKAPNGYQIEWNPLWGYYQVSHPEIGNCIAEFKILDDAIEYCDRG